MTDEELEDDEDRHILGFIETRWDGRVMMSKDDCPGPHKVLVDWSNVSPYTLPDNIVRDGGCSEGCCDDFKCTLCDYTFRIECPD